MSASGNRRKKCDFVTSQNRNLIPGHLLVDRRAQILRFDQNSPATAARGKMSTQACDIGYILGHGKFLPSRSESLPQVGEVQQL